jgi:hypothetical protein
MHAEGVAPGTVNYHDLDSKNDSELYGSVQSRLQGQPDGLQRAPGRDEDPADLFVAYARTGEQQRLRICDICGRLAQQWLAVSPDKLRAKRGRAAELLYLCGKVGADQPETIDAVAGVARCSRLASATLSDGQSLQGFALRVLAGLLKTSTREVRKPYRQVFLDALTQKQSQALYALVPLQALWPDWEEYEVLAHRHAGEDRDVQRLLPKIDVFVELFNGKTPAPQ